MYYFSVYNDTAGEYRWRLVAPNGKIVADSAEGYTTAYGAKQGIEDVKREAPNAPVYGA